MTARELATFLSYIIVGLFIVALLLFVLAVQQLRRGRKGPYWRLRRRASQRGGILFLASLALFVIAGALTFYSGLAAVAYKGLDDLFRRPGGGLVGVILPSETPTPNASLSATPTLTLSPSPAPSATALPSLTATLTASPSPTDTPTATWTPSETPSPTASATSTPTVDSVVQLTPPVGARPASPGASIEITAADMEVSASSAPVEARTEFPAGITRIYFFIRYRGMGDGVAWSRVLYRDGQAVQGQAYLWSQGQRGESFFFFGNDEGYPPGSYELRLFVGDHETSRFAFEVVTGAGQ